MRPTPLATALLVVLLALVAGGCASAEPMRRSTVDATFHEIRARGLSMLAPDAAADGAPAPDAERPRMSVERLMVELRQVLADIPEDESQVLFDSLPQGLRWASGVERDRSRYLRDGVLTSHTYVRDALIDDYSYEGLERYVRGLERIATLRARDETIDSAPFAGPVDGSPEESAINPREAEIWHRYRPPTLYRDLLERVRAMDDDRPVTVASVFLPYTTEAGRERGASLSIYVAGGDEILGFDVLDTEGLAHESIASNAPSTLAAPFHALSRGFSWVVDNTLQAPLPGIDEPVAYPLNLACYTFSQVFVAGKETVFEVLKAPLAGLTSMIAEDRSATRMLQSTAQPLRNVGYVWSYHASQIVDRHGRPSVFQSLFETLGGVPFLGGYRPVYFDDPWTQYVESPANGGPEPTELADTGAAPKEHLHLLLTRGIHGRDADEQGNEAWRRYMISLVAEDRELRRAYGVESDTDLDVTVDAIPYPWGTVMDPVFSMMNLSGGYAYSMERQAERVLERYPGERPVVAMLGHSGGVQRITVASRLMWYRGIATETLYGVAGPSIAHAPTKPGQNKTILSKSEFQDADFTSQFSAGVSTLESLFLNLYQLPVGGFLWQISSWSRSYPVTHMNANITRLEGGQSTLHRNPGTSVPKRRDLSLSFFRDDTLSVLLEPWFLRHAAETVRRRAEQDSAR